MARMVPLDELYAQADFLIVLTPLNDSTRGLINMDVFRFVLVCHFFPSLDDGNRRALGR